MNSAKVTKSHSLKQAWVIMMESSSTKKQRTTESKGFKCSYGQPNTNIMPPTTIRASTYMQAAGKNLNNAGAPGSKFPKTPGVNSKSNDPKKLLYVYCGSKVYNLDTCPNITDEQLHEILIQLLELQSKGVQSKGTMIFHKVQKQNKAPNK